MAPSARVRVTAIDFAQGSRSGSGRVRRTVPLGGAVRLRTDGLRRNLDALRDGFEFDLKPGQGHVLELLNAEVAHREDPRWFAGLLAIAHGYSRWQLALGAPFFAMLLS